jgi:hypothetical protein
MTLADSYLIVKSSRKVYQKIGVLLWKKHDTVISGKLQNPWNFTNQQKNLDGIEDLVSPWRESITSFRVSTHNVIWFPFITSLERTTKQEDKDVLSKRNVWFHGSSWEAVQSKTSLTYFIFLWHRFIWSGFTWSMGSRLAQLRNAIIVIILNLKRGHYIYDIIRPTNYSHTELIRKFKTILAVGNVCSTKEVLNVKYADGHKNTHSRRKTSRKIRWVELLHCIFEPAIR